MSTLTPNLNLVLPIGVEKVSRQIINTNMTLIDTAVGGKINITDIVNNLTTNDPNKPLSAAQGYALNSNIATKAFTVTRNETNTTSGSFIGRKSGNVCVISIDCVTNQSVGWVTIGTSAEKPSQSTYGSIASTNHESTLLAIGLNGVIQIYSPSASRNYIGQIVFIV